MTGTALAHRSNAAVQVETLPPASASDILKKHPSPITQYLIEQRAFIEPLLPDGVKFLGVVWDLVGALAKDKQSGGALARCTPDSVFLGVAKIQSWGLEIGRTAHLVPFGTACTPLIDYKGEIQLAKDARVITNAIADAVYEGDVFEYERGLDPKCRHVPTLDPAKRGAMIGAVAILALPTREKVPYFMPLADIDAIRQKHSKQWKAGKCPDWYAKKTVVRQALKMMPKSARLDALLSRLDGLEDAPLAHETRISAALADAPPYVQDSAGETIDTSTGEILDAPAKGLAWARTLPLPWKNSPLFGKPIGDFSTDHLEKIGAWCERKIDEAGGDADPSTMDLYNATQILLEDRVKAEHAAAEPEPTASEPTDIPDLGIVDEPKGAPPGSLSHRMPPGGKVEDAYRMSLGDEPAKPSTDALRNG